MAKKWSEEEIDYLRNNYENKSCKEIADELNRTERSVQHKYGELNLKRKVIKHNPLRNIWYNICRDGSDWASLDEFENWAINNDWNTKKRFSRIDNNKPHSKENTILITKGEVSKKNWAKSSKRRRPKWDKDEVFKICENRYNTKNPTKKQLRCARRIWSNLKKYGVEFAQQLDNIKEKVAKTNIHKYGVRSPSQSLDIRNKQFETNNKRYGNPFFNQSNKKEENSIGNFINSLGVEFKSNYSILDGKEIDLYNDKFKLGIEYCGLYWHTELSPEPRLKDFHYNKYINCKKQNIKLITIFSDEWKFRNIQVKSFLKSSLGFFNNRIFARKCKVISLDKKIGQEFCNKYHIQEQKRTAVFYGGLIFNDELIGVMSINNHHRDSNKIVLDRLCFKDGYQIIGGASKLLKFCLTNTDSKILYTWSDNRWSTGELYNKIGFIKDKELSPDYSYVKISNAKKRISKQSMKKASINCPPDKTELEYTKELGYARIWDCGKIRWKYIID